MTQNDKKDYLNLVFQRGVPRGKYAKFTKESKAGMRRLFEKNYYPSKNDYDEVAREIGEPVDKIINWFKHERRKYLNTGKIETYKKRKIFTKDEETILEKSFVENTKPHAKKYTELSIILNSTRRQIRKWFSYRRIKLDQLRDRNKIIDKNKENKTKKRVTTQNKKKCIKTKKILKKIKIIPMKAILKYKRKTGRVLKQKEIKIEQIPIKEEENFEKKEVNNINSLNLNSKQHNFLMQSKLLLAQNNMNNYMNQLYLQNLSNQMLFRQHTLSNFPQNIMNFTNFMNVYPVNPSIDLMKMNFYGNLMKAQNNIFFNKM